MCPQDRFHGKHLLRKKNIFQIIFRILDGDFSGFRQKFSSTVVRTALDSRFLIGIMLTFFGLYANFFDWSVRIPLYLPTGLFSWKASTLKKNTFPFVFHILGANFSGCRQNFSITVVGTSLVSRFCNRIYANFFELYAKFYWLVCQNCTLRVHRIVFMGSIFFEKNTFPFVFHILGGIFSGFWANLFQHGSWNFIGFQVFKSELCQLFSDFTQSFLDSSVGTALYVSTGSFSWEASSLKKKTLFKLYFAFWTETFQFFGKRFPAR